MGEWPRRAVLIVHGIGVQSRGTTRDALVAALENAGASDQGYQRGDAVPFGAQPPPLARRVRRGELVADVYEVYWSPQASRRTTARSVLMWMLRNTFLSGVAFRRPTRKTRLDLIQLGVFAAAVSLLVLMSLTTLGNLIEEASCATSPRPACSEAARGFQPAALKGPGITWGGWVQLSDAARTLGRAVRPADRPLDDLTPSHASDVLKSVKVFSWLALAVIVWLSAQFLVRLAALVRGGRRFAKLIVVASVAGLLFFVMQFSAPVLVAFAWVLALTTVLLRMVRVFLAESVGDVYVYVSLDENSEHFSARQAILAEAERVFSVVAARGYEEIVVLGHSLGAVIAFDVLEGLRFRDPPLLPRIRVFITFGAAIEKVRYLFDQKTLDSRERHVLTASAFAGVAVDRAWINVWYGNDVIADPIVSLSEPGWEPLNRSAWTGLDTSDLINEAREAPVLNLHYRRLWPLWPPIHGHYLKDRDVGSLIAQVALTPEL